MIGIQIIWVALPLASTADESQLNDWEYRGTISETAPASR
jgi:hypothetical protein